MFFWYTIAVSLYSSLRIITQNQIFLASGSFLVPFPTPNPSLVAQIVVLRPLSLPKAKIFPMSKQCKRAISYFGAAAPVIILFLYTLYCVYSINIYLRPTRKWVKWMKQASIANIANIASEWSERCEQTDIARDRVARLKRDRQMKKRALSLYIGK